MSVMQPAKARMDHPTCCLMERIKRTDTTMERARPTRACFASPKISNLAAC